MMGEVLGRRRGGIGAAQGQHLGSGIPESAAGSAAANRLCGSHIDADLTRNGRHWTEIREEGKENRRTRFQPIYYTHIPPYPVAHLYPSRDRGDAAMVRSASRTCTAALSEATAEQRKSNSKNFRIAITRVQTF